ncbi:hypothetical protein QQ045_023192 [Rhodiola kirilowii]
MDNRFHGARRDDPFTLCDPGQISEQQSDVKGREVYSNEIDQLRSLVTSAYDIQISELEEPIFDGEKAHGWIRCANRNLAKERGKSKKIGAAIMTADGRTMLGIIWCKEQLVLAAMEQKGEIGGATKAVGKIWLQGLVLSQICQQGEGRGHFLQQGHLVPMLHPQDQLHGHFCKICPRNCLGLVPFDFGKLGEFYMVQGEQIQGQTTHWGLIRVQSEVVQSWPLDDYGLLPFDQGKHTEFLTVQAEQIPDTGQTTQQAAPLNQKEKKSSIKVLCQEGIFQKGLKLIISESLVSKVFTPHLLKFGLFGYTVVYWHSLKQNACKHIYWQAILGGEYKADCIDLTPERDKGRDNEQLSALINCVATIKDLKDELWPEHNNDHLGEVMSPRQYHPDYGDDRQRRVKPLSLTSQMLVWHLEIKMCEYWGWTEFTSKHKRGPRKCLHRERGYDRMNTQQAKYGYPLFRVSNSQHDVNPQVPSKAPPLEHAIEVMDKKGKIVDYNKETTTVYSKTSREIQPSEEESTKTHEGPT